jgi:hypothetical protein
VRSPEFWTTAQGIISAMHKHNMMKRSSDRIYSRPASNLRYKRQGDNIFPIGKTKRYPVRMFIGNFRHSKEQRCLYYVQYELVVVKFETFKDLDRCMWNR